MSSKAEEITGIFQWEVARFSNGNGDPDTIIGRLDDGTTIKGPAAEGELDYDLAYRFHGRWMNHHKHGWQFVFSSFALSTPYGERGTIKYLARAGGIGIHRGQQIWNLYGPESVRVLKTSPDMVAGEVRGLTIEMALVAQDYFQRIEALEASTIAVTELLDGRGFPKRLIADVIQKWGAKAADYARDHPYELMAFPGVSFLGADKLYLDLRHPPEAIERQALCAVQSLREDSEGHTWFDVSHCRQALMEKVAGADVNLTNALWDAFDRGLIVRKVVERRMWVAETVKASNEAMASRCLDVAAKENSLWPMGPFCANQQDKGITEHQMVQLSEAKAGTIGILAGSPGTGKTYTLAQQIKVLTPGSTAVCAPTGKAAVRVTESLVAEGVHLQATTIHRLLGVEKCNDGNWRFIHGPDNPLPYRYIFVDESSMLDVDLLAWLLSACGPGTLILFVGDPDQLSPVGHGAPLRDMVAAGLPCGQLTEIHRNAGRIVNCCKEIREKHTFTPSPKLDLETGENLIVVERTSPEAQIHELQMSLEKLQGSKWHPVWDTFVLVAVNKKSALGRHSLNRKLQAQLNPNGKRVAGNAFRFDDKVINLKNSFLPALDKAHPEASEDGKIYVANGEMGRVIDATPATTVVKLDCPNRLVIVPKGQVDDSDNAETDTGCNWDLGYAITTHKSQGSEAPIVFPMIDEFPGARRLCKREWIYTGISRAKAACVIIGRLQTAKEFCKTSGLGKRKTFLRELIMGKLA